MKLKVFAAIPAGVLTVRVVCVAPVLVSELEPNEKNPPGGGEGHAGNAVGVPVKSTVQEVLLPLKVTVIW